MPMTMSDRAGRRRDAARRAAPSASIRRSTRGRSRWRDALPTRVARRRARRRRRLSHRSTVYFDPLPIDARGARARDRRGVADAAVVDAAAVGATDRGAGLLRRRVRSGPRASRGVRRLRRRRSDRAAHRPRRTASTCVGFVPGFAYLAPVDPRIAAAAPSRRRGAVPAGSVAIAGGQTGVYPSRRPGGWHLDRPHAGEAVRSRRAPSRSCSGPAIACASSRSPSRVRAQLRGAMPSLIVVRPGLLTTVQDLGRWGYQATRRAGGRADGRVLASARQPAGRQRRRRGALEVTLIGPELERRRRRRVRGRRRGVRRDRWRRRRCRSARRSRVARARGCGSARGTRARARTLAVAGGIDVPPVLGSRATHLVSRMGGARRAARCVPAIVCRSARRRGGRASRRPWPDAAAAGRRRAAARDCRVRRTSGSRRGARRAVVGRAFASRRSRIAWAIASRDRRCAHRATARASISERDRRSARSRCRRRASRSC